MQIFWYFMLGTVVVIGGVMSWVFLQSREVPDEWEKHRRPRLNADQLRILAYVLAGIIILCATMYELQLMYSD